MLLSSKITFPVEDIAGWVFDLDNTIYPESLGLFDQVAERMTSFLEETFHLDRVGAHELRRDLFHRHGTTSKGLLEEYDMDPQIFLNYVHDIDLSVLSYDVELDEMLSRVSGKKVIFTNGTTAHAMRILEAYGVAHHFSYCYDIIESGHRPKPDPMIYPEMLKKAGLDARSSVMIEDISINLKPASDLGMTTVWLDASLDWGKSEMFSSHIDYIAYDLRRFLSNLI